MERTSSSNEIDALKENVDSHIKEIVRRLSGLEKIPKLIEENEDHIQYNYELIYALKDEIESLKQEINALKLIQNKQAELIREAKQLKLI